MSGRSAPTMKRRRVSWVRSSSVVVFAAAAVFASACGPDAAEPVAEVLAPGTSSTTEAPPAPQVEEIEESAEVPEADDGAVTATPQPPPFSPASTLPKPNPPEPSSPEPIPPPAVQLDTTQLRTFPAPEVWEALRQCQSQGDYGFVHPSGEYFGAYQFTIATWDRLSRQRYPDLQGVVPSEATAADQDRMAYYLWIESGHARWPSCSHVFTEEVSPAAPTGDETVAGEPFEPLPGDTGATTTTAVTTNTTTAAASTTTTTTAASTTTTTTTTAAASTTTTTTTTTTASTTTTTTTIAVATTTTTTAATATTTTSVNDRQAAEVDPSMQPAIPPDVAGFPTPQQWEALRRCESSGNYRAVSANGRFYGAYQFWPDTWDYVAQRNYPRLVGVLPSAATTHDQDRMAYRLWEERGDQPWPVCGRYLR